MERQWPVLSRTLAGLSGQSIAPIRRATKSPVSVKVTRGCAGPSSTDEFIATAPALKVNCIRPNVIGIQSPVGWAPRLVCSVGLRVSCDHLEYWRRESIRRASGGLGSGLALSPERLVVCGSLTSGSSSSGQWRGLTRFGSDAFALVESF